MATAKSEEPVTRTAGTVTSNPDKKPDKVPTIKETRRAGEAFRVLAHGKTGTLHRDKVSDAPPATLSDAAIFRDLCAELGFAHQDVVSLTIDQDNVEIERVDSEAVARAAAMDSERDAVRRRGQPAAPLTVDTGEKRP